MKYLVPVSKIIKPRVLSSITGRGGGATKRLASEVLPLQKKGEGGVLVVLKEGGGGHKHILG